MTASSALTIFQLNNPEQVVTVATHKIHKKLRISAIGAQRLAAA
ncbi:MULTISPECIES: hypothetical protein [Sphingobium]|nr:MULTISPECIES: hypothetical protein [Sphingobium]